jgi:toxin CcdB
MRQFDVFANPDPGSVAAFPSLVVLQSDLVMETTSVIVAPLVKQARMRSRLYPTVVVADLRLAMMVTDSAAVPRTLLRRPVSNLEHERHSIIGALDLLFTGI